MPSTRAPRAGQSRRRQLGHPAQQVDRQVVSRHRYPATGGYAYATLSAAACSKLVTAGSPSTNDEDQGMLGDCYLIPSLGAIANSPRPPSAT